MTQRFKENDPTEAQIYGLLSPLFDVLGIDRDTFLADAYETYGLGDVLYDLQRDPLTDVITRDVYRTSYPAIHDLFTRPGTFEFYLDVFRRIFADDADVTFEIPSPGVLNIEVQAVTDQEFNLMARRIVGVDYVYERLVTSDTSDPIMAQGTRGIKTQAEMDALASEISMHGIITTITLTTGP